MTDRLRGSGRIGTLLTIIEGGQGAGKTYVCVSHVIITALVESDRPIRTNLPLNVPELVVYAAWLRWGKGSSDPEKLEQLQERIGLLGRSEIPKFWEYGSANTVYVLDELYEFFNSRAWSKRMKDDPDDHLLSYTRQHRHYKDDLYLVSHSASDLDASLRRGAQRSLYIRNSKYTNIFEWWILRGLKWPFQFFIVQEFFRGESECQGSFNLWPKQAVFACYDSFSQSIKLDGKEVAAADASSGDINSSWWRAAGAWFWQTAPALSMVCGVVVGFMLVIYTLQDLAGPSKRKSKETEVSDVESVASVGAPEPVPSSGAYVAKAEPPKAVITGVVYWSAKRVETEKGQVFFVGQRIGDWVVGEIGSHEIWLEKYSYDGRQRFRLSVGLQRRLR